MKHNHTQTEKNHSTILKAETFEKATYIRSKKVMDIQNQQVMDIQNQPVMDI